jgi:hypothetical protein
MIFALLQFKFDSDWRLSENVNQRINNDILKEIFVAIFLYNNELYVSESHKMETLNSDRNYQQKFIEFEKKLVLIPNYNFFVTLVNIENLVGAVETLTSQIEC